MTLTPEREAAVEAALRAVYEVQEARMREMAARMARQRALKATIMACEVLITCPIPYSKLMLPEFR